MQPCSLSTPRGVFSFDLGNEVCITARITIHQVETDCLQLVKLVEEDEFWPSMAIEIDEFQLVRSCLTSFTIIFIPRLYNVRADVLAKAARARDSLFTYVNSLIPSWLAHKASLLGPV
ncbi:unnamed protein product [Microthlaspi erraticum]|uniref:RNase H type-1 domain-containing protein n=1 Tax=Microthlaspi erraticum TaxID=1685480 RepID=A0A6D2IBD3_9BRAS|nr:unnamed protein product [Microthlaspi erraticum]